MDRKQEALKTLRECIAAVENDEYDGVFAVLESSPKAARDRTRLRITVSSEHPRFAFWETVARTMAAEVLQNDPGATSREFRT